MQQPPNHRIAVIQGYRELADALALNRGLPVPLVPEVAYYVQGGTDDEKRAEIDRIAELLGKVPEYSANGEHYSVTRKFGAVHYVAIMISERAMAQHDASTSYRDNFNHITEQEQTDE